MCGVWKRRTLDHASDPARLIQRHPDTKPEKSLIEYLNSIRLLLVEGRERVYFFSAEAFSSVRRGGAFFTYLSNQLSVS